MANLKYYNQTTGLWEEIKVSTKLKDLYNTEKLTQDQNYVNINITSFNPNEDVIFSICNSTWLQKDEDYIVNGGLLRIESKDGINWKNGDTFNFIVLKNVDKDALPSADGSLIQDGSITIAKLATSLQNYITKIGVTSLTTTATTLSDAINELNALLSENTQNISTNTTNINGLNTNKVNKIQGEWITGTLSNGWTGTLKYRKNDLGQVSLQLIDILGGTVTGLTIIATIPIGYTPITTTVLSTIDNAGNKGSFFMYINSLGNLYLVKDSNFVAGTKYSGYCMFNNN